MVNEQYASFDAHPREYCGLMGAYGIPDAAPVIYRGLFAQQHRGQEGAGIACSDGAKVRSIKRPGLLANVFTEASLHSLAGDLGIGHVRYSTTGSSKPQNLQPLVVECVDGIWSIAHNGNLVNAHALRQQYQAAGALFQTSTDSEILVHLIADPMFRTRPHRVARALAEIEGAFAFLLMTKDTLLAARDRFGFKPLSIGKLDHGYVVASETCALNQVGAEFLRDVKPGELITIDENGLHSHMFYDPAQPLGQCIFEHIYFARPDSRVFGELVHETRLNLGRRLAEEHPIEADVVIPVPDSGNFAALGFARAANIPLGYGFIRNHYVGRTFIMPGVNERSNSVDMKLAIVPGVVRGKRVVVVDDSIVRGNTCRRRVSSLREAGATEVHMRISCPPITHPCFFGIDFPSIDQLAAARYSLAEIEQFIGADSLAYLSLEGMLGCVNHPDDFCTGCFTGRYPVHIEGAHQKEDLENLSD